MRARLYNKSKSALKWLVLVGLLTVIILPTTLLAAQSKVPRFESAQNPEIQRSAPLPNTWKAKDGSIRTNTTQPARTAQPARISALNIAATAQVAQSLGPNLIPNPSLESAGGNGLPASWFKGGYGTNTRLLTYPATPAQDGAKAAEVSITAYTGGDAKWYFDYVPVTVGSTYQFSDYSISDVATEIDVQYKMNDGTLKYQVLSTPGPSATYQNNTAQFIVPSNVVSLTVFHVINRVGALTVDAYSLNQVGTTPSPTPTPTPVPTPAPTPPPPDNANLIANGDFEAGTTNAPTNWLKGGYGTNTRVLTYPVAGVNGSRAARVQISSYTSGDAKWYFVPVAISPSTTYTFSDYYQSDVQSILTAQFSDSNGNVIGYQNFATLPPSSGFSTITARFNTPANAAKVTVFHLIKSIGSLVIDDVSLRSAPSSGGIFTTGAVTLRFDDNWLSQYENAVPKLQSSGLKATFYVVSRQISDTGFPGYMSKAQVQQVYAMGHEIGAHTRTHADLATLSASQQQAEISGSRQDLLAWNVGPLTSFAYPFGSYTSTTIQIVKDAGFQSAGASIDGDVLPTSDPYQLERFSVQNTTTFSQMKAAVDNAIVKKEWVIFSIHEVNTSNDQYSITPALFNQLVDYLVQTKVPVVTVSQGMQSMP